MHACLKYETSRIYGYMNDRIDKIRNTVFGNYKFYVNPPFLFTNIYTYILYYMNSYNTHIFLARTVHAGYNCQSSKDYGKACAENLSLVHAVLCDKVVIVVMKV